MTPATVMCDDAAIYAAWSESGAPTVMMPISRPVSGSRGQTGEPDPTRETYVVAAAFVSPVVVRTLDVTGTWTIDTGRRWRAVLQRDERIEIGQWARYMGADRQIVSVTHAGDATIIEIEAGD